MRRYAFIHSFIHFLKIKCQTECEQFMISIFLSCPQPSIRIELIIPPNIVVIAVVGGAVGLLLLSIIAVVMFKVSDAS